jgi:hypothetical protein
MIRQGTKREAASHKAMQSTHPFLIFLDEVLGISPLEYLLVVQLLLYYPLTMIFCKKKHWLRG